MPILPNASVKSKVDFTRSRFEWKRQFSVAPTVNVLEEGTALIRVADPSGLAEVVEPSTAAASLIPAGISLQSRISAVTFTNVEELTVPTVAPFTVNLKKTTLLDTGAGIPELAVWDYSLGVPAYLNVLGVTPPAAATNVYATTAGLIEFDAARAGDKVRAVYRYILTAIERDELLRQSHVNRGAEDQFGLMTVAQGHCIVYTTMYDCSESYAVGDTLTLDANGVFSKSGATSFGTVISLATAGDPYLGVEYITPA